MNLLLYSEESKSLPGHNMPYQVKGNPHRYRILFRIIFLTMPKQSRFHVVASSRFAMLR